MHEICSTLFAAITFIVIPRILELPRAFSLEKLIKKSTSKRVANLYMEHLISCSACAQLKITLGSAHLQPLRQRVKLKANLTPAQLQKRRPA